MTRILTVDKLSVEEKISRRAILSDISFSAESGERIGIVGESGSGKSTLAKAIMSLTASGLKVTGGSIYYKDQELLKDKKQHFRGTGLYMIMQDGMSAFDENIRVGNQLECILRDNHLLQSLSKTERENRILETFKRVHLPDADKLYRSYSFQWSGGMLQRLMLAAAFLLEPDILICDEPTTALDTVTQKRVLNELKAYLDHSQSTLLFISHDLGVIRYIADRIIVMKDGHLLESTPAEIFFKNPASEYGRILLTTKRMLADEYHESLGE